MKTYEFTLVLADLSEITVEQADRLYEAGCDDGSPGSSGGVASITFARESPSLEEAINSAVADVERAGLRVAHLEANCPV
jgi:hypothetical protein